MQIHVIAGALSFCIFALGMFLVAGVRPLLMTTMKSEPLLAGPVLTRMFSRYNMVALVLSGLNLVVEMMSTRAPDRIAITVLLTLILALKLPFDHVIAAREKAAQIRGRGADGQRLERLHRFMEAATVVILLLSLGLFVFNVVPGSKL